MKNIIAAFAVAFVFFFVCHSSWGGNDEEYLEKRYREWQKFDEELVGLDSNISPEKMMKIYSHPSLLAIETSGAASMPFIIDKFKKGDTALFPSSIKILKKELHYTTISVIVELNGKTITRKVREYCDYPQLPRNKWGEVMPDAVLIYWWDHDLEKTNDVFKHYFDAWQRARADGNISSASQTMRNIRDMGIVVMPDLLANIEKGGADFINILSYLSDGGISAGASAEECKQWWKLNKAKYIIVKAQDK